MDISLLMSSQRKIRPKCNYVDLANASERNMLEKRGVKGTVS